MNENTKDTLLIMGLLSGRLLHDFASPMTGIMFSLEELETGDGSDFNERKKAFLLLKESSNSLICTHKIMQQAYSSSADNHSFDQTKSNIKNFLLKKKIQLTWDTNSSNTGMFGKDLIEKINKIISNMALTIVSAVAEVERMSILLSQMEKETSLMIKISNERRPLSGSLVDISKKNDINLNTKDIVVYMTSLLLEQYKAKVNHTCKSNYIDISIKL